MEMAQAITERDMTMREFMEAPASELMVRLGVTHHPVLPSAARDEAMVRARKEQHFIDAHHIRFIPFTHPDYPPRLASCPGAPVALYVLGNADLNALHTIAMVGTRRATALGTAYTQKIIADLSTVLSPAPTIISGLAYGIDAAAHQGALLHNCPTIAVLAHGLDTLYPASHRTLARNIIEAGGALISEYPSGVKPLRPRFLERNRIVAALSDATIVMESEIKGGAMSTANHAFTYSREVMAMPGRINDPMSSGCNLLIRKQKASLITDAGDILATLGWAPTQCTAPQTPAPTLFSTLPEPQGGIHRLLEAHDAPMLFDDICSSLAIPPGELLSILQEMEFDGILERLPGNRFSITI